MVDERISMEKTREWHKLLTSRVYGRDAWTQGDFKPAFSLEFEKETQAFKLLNDDSSELQLQDVIQDVGEVVLKTGSVDEIRRLFDAINSSKTPRLCSLFSKAAGLNDAGVEILAESIQLGCLSSLTDLTIIFDDLGNGHFALAKAIGSGGLPKLKYLNLKCTALQCDAYEIAFTKLPSLISINLSSNEIGNKGAEVLGRVIKSGHWKILQWLSIDDNAIGDDGINALVTAIQGETETSMLPKLKVLNLSTRKIGEVPNRSFTSFTEVSIISLAQTLQSGYLNSLETLYIEDYLEDSQKRSERGATAIVTALFHNHALVVDVHFGWFLSPYFDRRQRQLRERNSKSKGILAKLVNDPWVPASISKIYLCGNPEVGKTTLRRTLERGWLESLLTWERRPLVENRTRGIDVSQISNYDYHREICCRLWFNYMDIKIDETPMRLTVWDMAGQDEYHLVHNAFFKDLNGVESNATSFIIVCTTTNLEKSVKELDYWLRYIASSCEKNMRVQDESMEENTRPSPRQQGRHVFVVLNEFADGRLRKAEDCERMVKEWERVLRDRRIQFDSYLNIETGVFLGDVRTWRGIQGFKEHVMKYSRMCLENKTVPAICRLIQEKLPSLIAVTYFPVLEWSEFIRKVFGACGVKENEKIEAATKYLNEAGVLVYIDKVSTKESYQESISSIQETQEDSPRRLVVLDPNWFCREIVGHIFLTPEMVKLGEQLFRMKVEPNVGSISKSDFKKCFTSEGSKWGSWLSDEEFEDLIVVLLWLGVCFRGKDQDLFFPALGAGNVTPGGRWDPENRQVCTENQWVMGFLVEHQKNSVALAPMSLWHSFQVKLGQNRRFNGDVQNKFVAAKYFMSFTVDLMDVLIEVDANKRIPTFDHISILVKPMLMTKLDPLDGNQRKQCQVDQGSDLVEILLDHWNQVCPGVEYFHRVVWPWPASQLKPIPEGTAEDLLGEEWLKNHGLERIMEWPVGRDMAAVLVKKWLEDHFLGRVMNLPVRSQRNVEDLLLKKWVEEHNLGRIMNWPVGLEKNVEVLQIKKWVEEHGLGKIMHWQVEIFQVKKWAEAHGLGRRMHLQVGSSATITEDQLLPTKDKEIYAIDSVENSLRILRDEMKAAVDLQIFPSDVLPEEVSSERPTVALQGNEMCIQLHTEMILKKLNSMGRKLDDIRELSREILKVQNDLLHRFQDTNEIFLQDKEKTCPQYIYLGAEKSGAFTTLKNAYSETVRLHFFCEAEYSDCGPHEVKDQIGVELREYKDWAKAIIPWLNVSLTVLLISAKVATKVMFPVLGMILPDSVGVQRGKTFTPVLSEGLELFMGYSKKELDDKLIEEMKLDAKPSEWNPRVLYGKSREAMTRYIGKLSPETSEKKLGLIKVCLRHRDGSVRGVFWICRDCFEKYRGSDKFKITELK